jgi:deoxyribodipyrimidine photo-lyase
MLMDELDIFRPRLKTLNRKNVCSGQFVLYWMQQSQRAEFNHALEYGVKQANDHGLPLLVIFVLTENYPEANIRHYTFMFEGLAETQKTLKKRGIRMIVREGHPPDAVLMQSLSAAMVICDRGYLRHQKKWRKELAAKAPCLVMEVESDVVVPVGEVSRKAEYAAYTIRPRIKKKLDKFLKPVPEISLKKDSLKIQIDELDLSSMQIMLQRLDVDREVFPVTALFKGGTSQAKNRFEKFVRDNLVRYKQNSNQPQTDDISQMSPYLHFGQISPVYLSLKIMKYDIGQDIKDAFMEQLVIRRELAVNYAEYTSEYDQFHSIPEWAQRTLNEHQDDHRIVKYDLYQLENFQTHDEYWNAAMREMKYTGFMHNYMRMYWGKKILEWSMTPEQAFKTALYLNNKYFLDGRDPNSYAGVSWLFGLHDRPFKERNIFGKVRYMAASGLERKCDIKSYVEKVNNSIKYFFDFPSKI